MNSTIELSKCKKIDDHIFQTNTPVFKPYIVARFELEPHVQKYLKGLRPNFGYNGYGELVFYRTYSRLRNDNIQEDWADCVIRVINGIMSIRKDWYIKHGIHWDELSWQLFASKLAKSMYYMKWLPPGRGLWAMGTDYIYESGSLSLYNCAFTKLDNLPNDIHWLMDALMNGVGPGLEVIDSEVIPFHPNENNKIKVMIGDSREEWCDATKILLESYLTANHPTVELDYSLIRPAGKPIKRFGGVASGPEPLIILHNKIKEYFKRYMNDGSYNSVMLKADIGNQVGVCVVAGNVRRSAEIIVGNIEDETFLDLKNYEKDKFAYRKSHGWMSNNSARMCKPEHFEKLRDVSERIKVRGEPGLLNILNFKNGRIGKQDNLKEDLADGINPCGEIPLENKEVCNLADLFPTQCTNINEFFDGCNYATFYCSTVTLLPTHRTETNKVVSRNRRIGVGLVDFTGWKHINGLSKVVRWMRDGYKIVRQTNKELAEEAGIPESNRVTTVKPGGTTVNLPGKTSGIGYPNFSFIKRAIRIQKNAPIYDFLVKHNVPHEPDVVSMNTEVFYFPIKKGPAKPASKASLWEQAMNLVLVQREWADNAVSNTLNFKPRWKLISSRDFKTDEDYINEVESKLIEYDFGPDKFDFEWCASKNIEEGEIRMQLIYEIDSDVGWSQEQRTVRIYQYDQQHEEDEIEHVLANIAPLIKSVSMLPHTAQGAYEQMPETEITEQEFDDMLSDMKPIDWRRFHGSDGIDEKFCNGDSCEMKRPN